jgi:hypothetical protein
MGRQLGGQLGGQKSDFFIILNRVLIQKTAKKAQKIMFLVCFDTLIFHISN